MVGRKKQEDGSAHIYPSPMPSCNYTRLNTLNCSRRLPNSLNRHGTSRLQQIVKRHASSAVALKPNRSVTLQPSVPEVLTALHKTSAFLPRVLPRRHGTGKDTQTVEFWDELLDAARESLSAAPTDRVARVVGTCYLGFSCHLFDQNISIWI